MDRISCLKDIAESSTFFIQYIPNEVEALWFRIDSVDNEFFYCHSEDSGEEYEIRYEDIDLSKDKFYELKEVEFSDYIQLKGIS